MLGQRSIYHQGWLAYTLHPPISGWGHSTTTSGSSTTSKGPLSDAQPGRRGTERVETLKSLWFYYPGIYNGLPLDDRTHSSRSWRSGRTPAPDRARYEYYPDCAECRSAPGWPSTAARTRSRRGSAIDSPTPGRAIRPRRGSGGHSLYVKNRRLRYAFNWMGTHLQGVVSDRELPPGTHVLTAEFLRAGPAPIPTCRASGTVTLYVDARRRAAAPSSRSPVTSVWSATASASGATASPVTPDYAAPFPFRGGTIDKVVVDVSGERYVDHEAEVAAWFGID